MKLIRWHKNILELVKNKLGLSDYQLMWLAFVKGLVFGNILSCLL